MKKKIKKYTREFLGINQIENKMNQMAKQNQVLSFQILKELFPASVFFPLTVWSISPSTLLHIVNEITINNRRNIIEFGSGLSTIVISKLIKLNNLEINFFSVESDKEWMNKISNDLKKEGIIDNVKLIFSPLKKSKYHFFNHEIWYDTEILEKAISNHKFDLVIIDGPPGNYKFSRYGAIPFLKNKLESTYFVLLDDTNRNEEKMIIESWNEALKQSLDVFSNYSIIHTPVKFDSKP